MNFTAELLRFGDRQFYNDWWCVYLFCVRAARASEARGNEPNPPFNPV